MQLLEYQHGDYIEPNLLLTIIVANYCEEILYLKFLFETAHSFIKKKLPQFSLAVPQFSLGAFFGTIILFILNRQRMPHIARIQNAFTFRPIDYPLDDSEYPRFML